MLRETTPRPLALAYHGVAEVALSQDPHRLFVSPTDLLRHITSLRRWGYTLVTFSAWAKLVRDGAGAGHAALTFDDGLADNATTLLSVLQATRAPATVFVISGALGAPHPDAPDARLVTVDGVRRMAAAGVEIGSHTSLHRDLSTLDADTALHDLLTSRADLQALVQQPIDTLAYPYGHADSVARTAAAEAGFLAACRTAGQGALADPLDLPRQAMGNRSSSVGLYLKARDAYEPLMHTLPGRAARRLRLRVHAARPR